MKNDVVNNQNKVDNINDTNKFEEVETYQEVEPIKKEIRTDSYFDGGLIELIGWKLLSFLVTIITLGIGAPWGQCMIYSYKINHTVYNGKRLKFEGTGGDLFVNIFKWILLSIITFGIYILFIPVKKTKWVISNIHFEDEEFVRNESFFDGKTIQLIGVNILCMILNFISFGLLYTFTTCFKLKWINKHTIINRKKLSFNGKAISLFGKYILWCLLTLITFGIYGLWIPIKMMKWQSKNTHIKVVGETEEKDKSLLIAIPIAIIGVILFIVFVTNVTKNINNIDDINIENVFSNFVNSNNKAESSNSLSYKSTDLENETPSSSTTSKSNEDSSNSKSANNSVVSPKNVLNGDFSYFAGTYIDVFGSNETLTITKSGKVTISGRLFTNKPANVKKNSNGSYSCIVDEYKEFIIYPAGVKNGNGDTKKVRIDVIEGMGALCFQKK